MAKTAPRSSDEIILEMIRARAAGYSSEQLERVFGIRASGIRTITNRVREADIAHSDEPGVAEAYWGKERWGKTK